MRLKAPIASPFFIAEVSSAEKLYNPCQPCETLKADLFESPLGGAFFLDKLLGCFRIFYLGNSPSRNS